MKIGVIGAGNWGKNLVNNFTELGVLAGVADGLDENLGAAKQVCEHVVTYTNHHDLLADGYDAVAVATPAHTHYEIAKDAIAAGCDVFIEKPMTLDVEEAQKLKSLQQSSGKIIMVGHLLMYQPAIGFIKKYLDDGKLGKVYSLHQRRSKLGRVRAVENVLWSFGVHDVAVLLHLVGESPVSLQVSGHAGVQNHVEDDTYLHLDFANGIKTHLHNSWLWPRVERSLTVVGENGMLYYDELEQNVKLVRKTVNTDLSHSDEGEEIVFDGSGQPLRLELEHFMECCKNRKQPQSCVENGLAVVKVLAEAEAILKNTRDV